MIIQAILNLVFTVLQFAFGWINLPAFPENLKTTINTFLSFIFDNLTVLGFFIRPITISITVPILLILINFDHVYKFTMWIIKKIPMLNIK